MSEHTYLAGEETEYIRHHSVRFGWTTEGDTKRLIDDISALRAELDRMRTALKEIEFATRDNDLFALIHEVAVRALNPQPAQQEKA